MHFEFWKLIESPYFLPAFVSWILAQILKGVIVSIKERKINLLPMLNAGGMPSSHTSFMIGLTTSIGIYEGFSSTAFICMLALSLIVMNDASGVRRAAGKQARLLNEIAEKLSSEHELDFVRLKELIGHEPREVLAGFLLGIAIAVLFAVLR